MKKLKIIRIVLIILIFLSVFAVILNFYKPPKIKIQDDTKPPADASMLIENGKHELFSSGKRFARFTYKQAVQKKKVLAIEGVQVFFYSNKGQLNAPSASFKEGIIYFDSEVKGFLPEKKATILVLPPSRLKDKRLFGDNGITINLPEFSIKGTRFVFNIGENLLTLKKDSKLFSQSFNLTSYYNTSFLKEIGEYYFFKNVVLFEKKDKISVYSDTVKIVGSGEKMYFGGRSILKGANVVLFFNDGILQKQKQGYMLKVTGRFRFNSQGLTGQGDNATVSLDRVKTDYLRCNYSSYVFSGVNNIMREDKNSVKGDNPYLYSKIGFKTIKGDSYLLEGGELKVFNPVLKDKGFFLVSSNCLIDEKSEIKFPFPVYGVYNDYKFTGSSAYLNRRIKVIKNGKIVSLTDESDNIHGNVIELTPVGKIVIKGNVSAEKKMRKGALGNMYCDYMEVTHKIKRAYMEGKVKIFNGNLKAYPMKAVTYKNFSLLFDCNFTVEGKFSGFARVIVVNFNSRYSYLFFAKVKDVKGNTLQGDKLTLDNVTDRIFIEKTKQTGQVEVKIKI